MAAMPPPPPPQAAPSAAAAQQQAAPQDQAQQAAPAGPPKPNPGPFDGLHNEIRSVLPAMMVFEGARVGFQKPIGQRLALTHNIVLNNKESAYKLQSTYIGNLRQKSEQETYPICIGEVDHSGKLMANIIHEAADNLKFKYQLQTDGSDVAATALETELTGSDYTAGLKMINFNPAKSKGTWVLNYLQKVTSRLHLGAELQYQHMPNLSEYSGLNFGGRYRTDDWACALTMSPMGVVQATYVHHITKAVTGACELEMHLPQQEVQASIGFQHNFKTSIFRGQITSGGAVMGFFEKQLVPGFMFLLSAVLDHSTSKTIFGIGVQIGH